MHFALRQLRVLLDVPSVQRIDSKEPALGCLKRIFLYSPSMCYIRKHLFVRRKRFCN